MTYQQLLLNGYWFHPSQSRKQHIFDNLSKMSLCGKWGALGFDRDHPGASPIGHEDKQQTNDCAGCWAKRNKLLAKAA